ncbi:hypothetical protein OFN61_41480, partial [Escherichia coli]|nr:hypothetical protein [Escherichia coli]
VIQNWYGHHVLDYWLTLGKDRSSITTWGNICFYGGLFDAVCAAFIRLLGTDVWDTRHFFCALTGLGTIWFTARLAK